MKVSIGVSIVYSIAVLCAIISSRRSEYPKKSHLDDTSWSADAVCPKMKYSSHRSYMWCGNLDLIVSIVFHHTKRSVFLNSFRPPADSQCRPPDDDLYRALVSAREPDDIPALLKASACSDVHIPFGLRFALRDCVQTHVAYSSFKSVLWQLDQYQPAVQQAALELLPKILADSALLNVCAALSSKWLSAEFGIQFRLRAAVAFSEAFVGCDVSMARYADELAELTEFAQEQQQNAQPDYYVLLRNLSEDDRLLDHVAAIDVAICYQHDVLAEQLRLVYTLAINRIFSEQLVEFCLDAIQHNVSSKCTALALDAIKVLFERSSQQNLIVTSACGLLNSINEETRAAAVSFLAIVAHFDEFDCSPLHDVGFIDYMIQTCLSGLVDRELLSDLLDILSIYVQHYSIDEQSERQLQEVLGVLGVVEWGRVGEILKLQ